MSDDYYTTIARMAADKLTLAELDAIISAYQEARRRKLEAEAKGEEKDER